jgi:predicted phosphodiesterase
MRLGILTDIHEDVTKLKLALQHCRQQGVEQIVLLGDVFENGRDLREAVTLLAEAKVVGVWGNHELGLCHKPDVTIQVRYAGPVLDFMKSLKPRLELDGCLFTHGLPGWDASDPAVFYLGEGPETTEGLASSFGASDHAVMFTGHFHRWLAATPQGALAWDGGSPICLPSQQRYLVVIAAVCDGWCAVFDTISRELLPHRIAESGP